MTGREKNLLTRIDQGLTAQKRGLGLCAPLGEIERSIHQAKASGNCLDRNMLAVRVTRWARAGAQTAYRLAPIVSTAIFDKDIANLARHWQNRHGAR
jgi:hypothetical protein